MLDFCEAAIEPVTLPELCPVYDTAGLVLAIQAAATDFHARWDAILGFQRSAAIRTAHWAEVKALNRRVVLEIDGGELAVRVAVGGQRVAEDDVADILPLDKHVRLADCVGFRVEFLPEHREPRLRVHRGQVLFRDRQHTARSGRRIVDRAHDAGLGQNLVILDEDQIDHEADDLARGEVLSRRLVGEFRELADQLFENEAHLGVVDDIGVEIDVGEFLGDQIEQVGLGEPVDLDREFEALEDVADVGREGAASRATCSQKLLSPARLQLSETQDDVAIVLAGPAHGPRAVDDSRLDVDEAIGRPGAAPATEARPEAA